MRESSTEVRRGRRSCCPRSWGSVFPSPLVAEQNHARRPFAIGLVRAQECGVLAIFDQTHWHERPQPAKADLILDGIKRLVKPAVT